MLKLNKGHTVVVEGDSSRGGVGSRKTFSGWGNKTISGAWGGKTFLEDGMAKYFWEWMAKHFG